MILSRSSLPLAGLEVGSETRPRAAGPAGQQGERSLALAGRGIAGAAGGRPWLRLLRVSTADGCGGDSLPQPRIFRGISTLRAEIDDLYRGFTSRPRYSYTFLNPLRRTGGPRRSYPRATLHSLHSVRAIHSAPD